METTVAVFIVAMVGILLWALGYRSGAEDTRNNYRRRLDSLINGPKVG